MAAFRCLALVCLLVVTLALADPASDGTPDTAADPKPRILLRKRRTTSLPNNANIRFESKLTVPQSPTGLYQVWFGPVRFYIRELFSSSRWVPLGSCQVRSDGRTDLTRAAAAGRGQGHSRAG